MKNILECYAYEDAEVGYIQGMNMILSGLLYHVKDEIKAFAVFRKLIYEMRTIYFNGKLRLIQTSKSATITSSASRPTSKYTSMTSMSGSRN